MESVPARGSPIMIVDDDIGLLLSLKAVLVSAGLPEPILTSNSRRALDLIVRHSCRVVLLDLIMPRIEGLEVLKQIKEERPETECIILTAVDEAGAALEAMRLGACEYLVKPFYKDKLLAAVNRALDGRGSPWEPEDAVLPHGPLKVKNPEAFSGLIIRDEAMVPVLQALEAVAPTDYSLIISGETGVGKELFARALHDLSERAAKPFVPVNMAASSKWMFEDDFFGHRKGAFTGAEGERKGFFETAGGGTLFLDEIAELEPGLQAKLLRVIQEREIYRLGSSTSSQVDARLIAATNADLAAEVKAGRFRRDLYYRLNVFSIRIPPLRERKKDILPLAGFFLAIHAKKGKRRVRGLHPRTKEILLAYHYPGNVRELENIITSAVLLEKSELLKPGSLPDLEGEPGTGSGTEPDLVPLAEVERRHIEQVLAACQGNRARAAHILGIGERTLYRKLKAYRA